ncbi:MAG: hypothetical protein ACK5ZY_07410, partial [Cyclobacteriaceae bacterium]
YREKQHLPDHLGHYFFCACKILANNAGWPVKRQEPANGLAAPDKHRDAKPPPGAVIDCKGA